MPSEQMLVGSLMIVFTVAFHVAGLVGVARVVRHHGQKVSSYGPLQMTLLLTAVVLAVIFIHLAEALFWAFLFLRLQEFESLEDAIYFSAVTATTLGYGDLTLSVRWRLLSVMEAMSGLILFGVSTAFLLAMARRLFAIEPGPVAKDKSP